MATEDRSIARRSQASELMPPPPLKKIKRPSQVLDEDVYTQAVSQIIARDFFPGLQETEAQNEYLTALKSNDRDWIHQAGRNLTTVMTPGRRSARNTSFTPARTIAGGETPSSRRNDFADQTPVSSDISEHIRPEVDINMSLGAFQSKYTSEDNESFNEVLDRQNNRRATKYAHFFHGNKIPTSRQIEYRAERRQIEASQNNSQALVIQNSSGEQRQLLAPDRPSEDLDLRPASLDSFPDRQGPRNAFMFAPDSVEDRLPPAAETSMAPPKAITYSATRLNTGVEITRRPPSPTLSAIDAAIARRGTAPPSSAGYSGSETPRVNGYAFVDAEPTPSELGTAVDDDEADAAERAAFDKLLPKAEGEQNPFHILQQSKREDLHHKLVNKSDIGRRRLGEGRNSKRMGTTPGRTLGATPRRIAAQMTPAAKSLAAKLSTPRRGW